MNFICRASGHKPHRDRWGGPAYGVIRVTTTDGMGTTHSDILIECDRCGEKFVVCKVHMPKDGK